MSEQRKSYLTKSLFLAVAVILIAIVAHQPGYPSITRQIEKSQDLPSGSVEPFFVKSFPDGQGILVAFSNQEKMGIAEFSSIEKPQLLSAVNHLPTRASDVWVTTVGSGSACYQMFLVNNEAVKYIQWCVNDEAWSELPVATYPDIVLFPLPENGGEYEYRILDASYQEVE